jgi:hypothetical protein
MNPSIVRWDDQNDLLCWRTSLYNSNLKFGWLNEDYDIDFSRLYLQIGFNSSDVISIRDFNPNPQDCRMIKLNNTTLAISYSVRKRDPKNVLKKHAVDPYWKEVLSFISWNSYENRLKVGESILLDFHSATNNSIEDQKNWMPFEHKQELHFIQSLNPLIIIRCTGNGRLHVVTNTSLLKYPWNRSYGWPLRGGSNLVYMRKHNLYLGFFHTLVKYFVTDAVHKKRKVYFWGAFTISTTAPFYVTRISSHPLYVHGYYDIDPAHFNHIVLPFGLVLDRVYDDLLWLSLGVNDKDGLLLKINTTVLLQTMQSVVSIQSP